jgi:lipoyl(octanoyl) transferase
MTIEVKNTTKSIDYHESINILEERVKDVLLGNKRELLWIVEYGEDVYSAGIRAKSSELLNKNINLVNTNRGGKITYHGPGQKVVYFVLDLNKRGKDIRKLVKSIEECIINILDEYNIKSKPDRKNVGIWVKEKDETKKIAAIGIKVKKWIAYHGFSLNIDNDIKKYRNIIPCGLDNKKITNLKSLGIKNCSNINEVIIKNFLNIFHS